MIVSSTEVQNNFGKYMMLTAKDNIIITKNGVKTCRLIAYNEYDTQYDETFMVKETAPSYDRKKVPYEKFLEIYENTEERYEYIDGEIYLLSSPKTSHQTVLLKLIEIFQNYFKGKKCTPMIAPYDIKLERDENNKNIVQPDLMVICDLKEKLGKDDYYKGVPTLIVEILSPSTRSKDIVKKLDLYMCCGVNEYWTVDPDNKEVHVFLFKDKGILKSKTYFFGTEFESFFFEGLKIRLEE